MNADIIDSIKMNQTLYQNEIVNANRNISPTNDFILLPDGSITRRNTLTNSKSQ